MGDKDKEAVKADLGLLEEDDEFEEFPADGTWSMSLSVLVNVN